MTISNVAKGLAVTVAMLPFPILAQTQDYEALTSSLEELMYLEFNEQQISHRREVSFPERCQVTFSDSHITAEGVVKHKITMSADIADIFAISDSGVLVGLRTREGVGAAFEVVDKASFFNLDEQQRDHMFGYFQSDGGTCIEDLECTLTRQLFMAGAMVPIGNAAQSAEILNALSDICRVEAPIG